MKRSAIKQRSPKRAGKYGTGEGKAGMAYMKAVKALPCVVCGVSPCDAHHVFHGRYGARKASDFDTIPLCRLDHLDGPHAIHKEKASWRERHGPDWGYIEQTRRNVAAYLGEDRWNKIQKHIE